jgi:hypothetical protein
VDAFGSKEQLIHRALDMYSCLARLSAYKVIEYLLRKSADAHADIAQPPGCFFIQGALPYSDKPPAPKGPLCCP